MATEFSGKVLLVTGAGNGIGRAHALAFARAGARVVVNDLGGARDGTGSDTGAAEAVVGEIRSLGGEAVANTDSVADAAGAKRMVEAALAHWGRLDVVVNNAGILRDRSFLKLTEAEWDLVVAVHLKGTYHVCRAAIPALARQGGSIVNTTSVSGLIGNFGQSNYAAAKAGVYGLTRVLALELKKAGITVNAIAPIAHTRMTEDIAGIEPTLSPEHVSPVVVFLASEAARGITGTVVGVAGQRLHLYEVHTNDGVEKPGVEPWTTGEIAEHWSRVAAWAPVSPASAPAGGPDVVAEAFALVPLAYRADRAGDWRCRIHFVLKEGGGHTLVVDEGNCRVEPGATGRADCAIKTDRETIVGIFNQTIAPDKAFMKGKITADNMSVLMKFAMAFDFSARPASAAASATAAPTEAAGPRTWPIGKTWEAGAAFVEPRFAALYAECTSDPSPRYAGPDAIVPAMFHVRLFHALMFKVATDPELGLDILRLVHGEHDATFHRPLRPWDLVQLRARLEAVEEKASGTVVTSRLFGFVDGELAVEALTTYFVRGPTRAAAREISAPPPAPPRPDFTVAVPIASDLSHRYAVASLDDNPIHIDPVMARAAGHPDLLLQGLCTMALTGAASARAVGGEPREIRRLAVRFARPVPNGTTLTVSGWAEGADRYRLETALPDGTVVIRNAVVEFAPR